MTTAAAQARYPLTQGVNPWLVTALRHAPHLHGGARHRHCLGGPALHRRLALGLQLRSHLGPHQLPGRQRRHPARLQLVRPPLRPQALPAHLRHHLHHRLVLLRSGAVARRHSARPRAAGRRRRRAPAALAIHPAGKLSRPAKRSMSMAAYGLGIVRRPGPRPHARRLAHRHLQLALRLLHQHPRRHSRRHHDHPLRPRPALHQERQGRRLRQHRLRPAHGLDRLPADRPRQGPGRRLVRRHLGALGRRRARHRAHRSGSGAPGPTPKASSTCTSSRTATSAPAAS